MIFHTMNTIEKIWHRKRVLLHRVLQGLFQEEVEEEEKKGEG